MLNRRRALGELGAVVATGLGFLYFENVLERKLEFLLPCVLLWGAYVVARLARERGLAAEWGMGAAAIRPALAPAAARLAAGVFALGAWRLARGWTPFPPGAWILFLAYPAWSFVQQFVLQALVAGNLERLGASRTVIVPVAAVLFGLAHAPDWALAGLCAAAGLAWTALYLRTRSLYPLALSHAVLGALAYYWVLERDPWREMFPAGVF
jgi:hypothetical protein